MDTTMSNTETTTVPCPQCKEAGEITVRVTTYGEPGESSFKMECPECRGAKRISLGHLAARNAELARYCKCSPNEYRFGSYPEDGMCPEPGCIWKHHVHCGNCGLISQVG